jgi:hypothetical protein
MAEPVHNTETGGRSLADILREAGIENPSRSGRRRRWDDVDDAGIRQRQSAAEDTPDRAGYGRRSSDLPPEKRPAASGPRRERDGDTGRDPRRGDREPRRPRDERSVLDDRTGRVERPEHEARRPRDSSPREERPRDGRSPRDDRPAAGGRPGRDRRRTAAADGERPRGDRAPRGTAPDSSTAAIPGLRPSRTPSVPPAAAATATTAAPPERRRRRLEHPSLPIDLDPAPSTGPIPALQVDDVAEPTGEDAAPREGALAWLRFAGELVIAAAAGVGIYFAFTVLWQTLPHVAVIVAPLAVTGLVAGVGVWRQRLGHAHLGPRLLAVLVFAGTLLTVLPAAGLITRQ